MVTVDVDVPSGLFYKMKAIIQQSRNRETKPSAMLERESTRSHFFLFHLKELGQTG